MQIQYDYLSNLPKELIREICIPHLFYKSYTALACCTKKFNEIAKEHSIISWPIKVTPLKELKGVTYAMHHVGCQILAVKDLKEGLNTSYNKYYGAYEAIYELESGKLITNNWETKTPTDLRKLELGLDFPYKNPGYDKNKRTPFITDCATVTDCINGIFDETRNYRITGMKMSGSIQILNIKSEVIASLPKLKYSSFVYIEKKGYLIFENDQNSIIIYDVDSNNIKFSLSLPLNEKFFKFVYNEARDHLVFFSGTSETSNYLININLNINIYEVSTGKLLKRFTLRDAHAEVCDLLLYLPEKMLVITADRNTCMIYDLISTKLYRRISLKDLLPIKQLSFQNNSLYITQVDLTVYNDHMPVNINEIPNCIVSKIDFFKPESLPIPKEEIKPKSEVAETNDCACTIL